jgi:DNA-directed RNA polymerase sigma subunit (sigma70/sigma32)
MTEAAQREGTITLEQVAMLLQLSKERVRQLVASGHIPKVGRNTYSLVGAVRGYLRLKDEELLRVREAASNNGLRSARQREIELRIAIKERELIEIEEAYQIIAFFIAQLHAEFEGLPRRVTRDRDFKQKIQDEIDAAFTRVAEAAARAGSELSDGEGMR